MIISARSIGRRLTGKPRPFLTRSGGKVHGFDLGQQGLASLGQNLPATGLLKQRRAQPCFQPARGGGAIAPQRRADFSKLPRSGDHKNPEGLSNRLPA